MRLIRSLRAVVILALFAAPASLRADLAWFDLPVSQDRPHVTFADVIAWSDACLAVKPEEWPQVERAYSEYVRQWEGHGRDEDKLWEGLTAALGTERAACIESMRACMDAILRTRDASPRHIEVRRQLLGLASIRGAQAPDAIRLARDLAGRISGAVVERSPIDLEEVPPATEVLGVRDAVTTLRGRMAQLLGEERADAVLASIVQAYELSGTTALSPEFRTIIEHANLLSPEEQQRLAAAYAAADAKLRGKLAYQEPREARTQADEALYGEVVAVLGEQRADLIRSLAGGYVDVRADLDASGPRPNVPLPDMMNSAADALLARFVDPAKFPEVEALFGRAYWRPMSWHGVKPKALPEPFIMDPGFMAAVAGAKGDDDLAIIESIHADYVRRYAQGEQALNTVMSKQGRLAAIADMSVAEDEAALIQLQTAFGKERISDNRLALARFARLERMLPFARVAGQFDTMDRIPWPMGSVASAALGQALPGIAPLPESHRAALRSALEEAAPSLVADRLAAWKGVHDAHNAFMRVLEQFAGHRTTARERLVAVQAARLEGLAASAIAAKRAYAAGITLVENLTTAKLDFEAQYFALALIEQDLGNTEAGRRLLAEVARIESPATRDRALEALIPIAPTAVSVLRACSDAALAAGNMDDGDLGRIEAGNKVLGIMKDARRRLDRAMRAQVAVSWRALRDAGNPSGARAFTP
ncbi:MAG: hypothetical protein RLZZ116_2739 [Planctomycetota bacterium]|jgi:hypothetical protein